MTTERRRFPRNAALLTLPAIVQRSLGVVTSVLLAPWPGRRQTTLTTGAPALTVGVGYRFFPHPDERGALRRLSANARRRLRRFSSPLPDTE